MKKLYSPKENSPSLKDPTFSALLRLTQSINTPHQSPNKNFEIDKEEYELKQQVLSSLLSEEHPIEGFKKYLELLIVKKTGKNSQKLNINTEDCAKNLLNEICKDSATLRLEDKLEKKFNKITIKTKGVMNQEADDNEADLEEANILEAIRKKNNLIIHTSKKLKNRMKLEKVDKEKIFNARMKPFSQLDTFINAKEFLEQVNPLNMNKKENIDNNKVRSVRLMKSIKKFQTQISGFFDEKIKDFITRVEEIELGKQQKLSKEEAAIAEIQNTDKTEESSDNSSESQGEKEPKDNDKKIKDMEDKYFKKIYDKIVNKDEESSVKVNKKNNDFMENMEKKKELFKYLNRNSLFIKQNFDENNSFFKAYEAYNNPSSLVRVQKSFKKKDVNAQIPNELMKQLIVTDPSFNIREFQSESQTIALPDEFYNKTMTHFSKQDLTVKKGKLINKENEKNSIKNLENLVHNIIHTKKKKENNDEMVEKYEEFKQKSSNILKLISKTSKMIFNEKNKNFYDKKLTLVRDFEKNEERLRLIKETRRKGLNLEDPKTFFTDLLHRKSDISSIKQKNSRLSGNSENLKKSKVRFSSFFTLETPKKPSILDENRPKAVSFRQPVENIDTIRVDKEPYIIKSGINRKNLIGKLDKIMTEADDVKELYKDEKKTLNKIEIETNKFFQQEKNKLKPRLESLAMTFEPIKIKNYHKKSRSFFKDIVRKEKQKLINSSLFQEN